MTQDRPDFSPPQQPYGGTHQPDPRVAPYADQSPYGSNQPQYTPGQPQFVPGQSPYVPGQTQYAPGQTQSAQGEQYRPGQPYGAPAAPTRRRRGLLIALIVGLSAVLIAAIAVGTVLALRPAGTTTDVPQPGPQPANKIKVPAAVTAFAATGKLTCSDELLTPWQIEGCYNFADGRIVQGRFKIVGDATIDKLQLQVLDEHVSDTDRAAELTRLAAPIFDEIKLSKADRALINSSLAAHKDRYFVSVDWGTLYLSQADSTITLGLAKKSVGSLPYIAVSTNYRPVVDELKQRNYSCKVDPSSSFECTKGDVSIDGGILDGGITTMSVWWTGVEPAADAPLMRDAYAALAKAGERGPAMRDCLARMNRDHPDVLFADGIRLMRWSGRIEFTGVSFT